MGALGMDGIIDMLILVLLLSYLSTYGIKHRMDE
jgi:hypothetical protein